MNYFVVKDKAGSVVWRGMAKDETAAFDAAARAIGLGSYRYAVALGALARDEWTADFRRGWRMCRIFGKLNGKKTELIHAPISTLGDIDRLNGEIPEDLYNAVEKGSIGFSLSE